MRDVSRQIEMGQHRAIRFWIVLKMFSCKTMERGHFPRRDSDTSATSFLLSNEYLNIWCEELRILICLYIYIFYKNFFYHFIFFFVCFSFSLISFYLFIFFFCLNFFVYLIFFLKFSSCLLFIIILLRFNSIARYIFELKYFIFYKLELQSYTIILLQIFNRILFIISLFFYYITFHFFNFLTFLCHSNNIILIRFYESLY